MANVINSRRGRLGTSSRLRQVFTGDSSVKHHLVLVLLVAAIGCSRRSVSSSSDQTRSKDRAQTSTHSAGVLESKDRQPHNRTVIRETPEPFEEPTELASAGRSAAHTEAIRPIEILPPQWDVERLDSLGIRKVAGEYLTLYTDLPPGPSIDALPSAFDQAVPQWCRYFDVPPAAVENWRTNGYLIKNKDRFQRGGLYPYDLPPFLHGFQRAAELWLYEQPSDYYRRHLLLHEGTHAFMKRALGGAGPPWYMEGMAELLATHRWNQEDSTLTLRYFPRDKDEVPYWGRIKKIHDELKQGRKPTLPEIMRYDTRDHLRVAPYAWCWAATAFLDHHPRYQGPFRQLRQFAYDSSLQFSRRYAAHIEADGPLLEREWQLFVANLVYGYDVEREALQRKPAADLPVEGAIVKIAANRGWQSTGLRLQANKSYRIEARGRYQIARESQILWCEPNGITLRYHRGRPLGLLLGEVVAEEQPVRGAVRLIKPKTIGLSCRLPVTRAGTLYLRVNDSPAELADNAGELSIRIQLDP